jgi:anti-sigma factor RsiW
MMQHLTEEQLNDLADGAADAGARSHLGECEECQRQLAQLQHIVARVHALPRVVAPRRDLLPDIQRSLDQAAQNTRGAHWRKQALWSLRVPLAAAALLLIMTTALITRMLLEPPGETRQATQQERAGWLVARETQALQQKYESAIAELEQLVDAQRANLAPSTLRLLQQNLRVIDRAIRESQEALEQDPNSELIHDLLRSAYQRKLELLRRATAPTTT